MALEAAWSTSSMAPLTLEAACKEPELISQLLQRQTVMHSTERKEPEPLGVAPNAAYMMAWRHCPKSDPHCVSNSIFPTRYPIILVCHITLASHAYYLCVAKQLPRAASPVSAFFTRATVPISRTPLFFHHSWRW
jgi:hypothetical protein